MSKQALSLADVLTTGKVASIVAVAPRTVSKWFDTGALGGYLIPGSRDRRIPFRALIRFIRQHRIPMDCLVDRAGLSFDELQRMCDELDCRPKPAA